jgi:DNA-binding LacI/PurR family transcriptional regulator
MTPKLTTWEQDTTELGRIAVDKLIEQIEKPLIAIPEQIIVRGRLLESETVQKIG